MTQDEIIRMARETGMISDSHAAGMISFLERFAALVAAAEREACIEVCEEHWQCGGNAMECADAIRATAEK